MRRIVLSAAFLIVSVGISAQTFSPAPVADATTLTLITDKSVSAGDSILLNWGSSVLECTGKAATPISQRALVAANGVTPINLKTGLEEKGYVCGFIVYNDVAEVAKKKKTQETIKPVAIGPANPSIVKSPQPAAGDMKVQLATGGKVANEDPVRLYSSSSAKACEYRYGQEISVDNSLLGPNPVNLRTALTAGAYICGEAGKDHLPIAAVQVAAPNKTTFAPDPPAGDQTIKVILGGVAAPNDKVLVYTTKKDVVCDLGANGVTQISDPAIVSDITKPFTITLTAKLQEGNRVCGLVIHGGQQIDIIPEVTVAAASVTPGTAPQPSGTTAPTPAPTSSTATGPGGGGTPAATVFTVTLNDPTTIAIKDTTSGAKTVDLFTIASPTSCAKGNGTLIALATPTADKLDPKTGTATLVLAKPLAQGTELCAIDSTDAPSSLFVYVPPQQPAFARQPFEGSGVVVIQATPSDPATTNPAWTVGVQLKTLGENDTCDTSHGFPIILAAGGPLASQNTDKNGSATFNLAPPLAAGSRICALQTITVNIAGAKQLPLADPQIANASNILPVDSQTDWGLVRAYFTGGTVISNDNSNFSSANLFFALNVDKTWLMPHCAGCTSSQLYDTSTISLGIGSTYTLKGGHMLILGATLSAGTLVPAGDAAAGVLISGRHMTLALQGGKPQPVSGAVRITNGTITVDPSHLLHIRAGEMTVADGMLTIQGPASGSGSMIVSGGGLRTTVTHNYIPGFNTFFDARLTAIPVASNPTNTTMAATTTTGTTPTTPTTTPSTAPSFISTQKTARIGVGVYLPVLLTRWTWNKSPNALFIAPMAKIGFDTITQAQSQNVILPGGAAGTQTYSQLYNYRSFGGRIGHMKLSGSPDKAPEVYSYLDIGFGPFSNLESLICNRTLYTPGNTPVTGQPTATLYQGSQCMSAYPSFYTAPSDGSGIYHVYETRKRIYRLDLEGLLKIPGTPLYVGFNANLGQKAVMSGMFDPQFKAPDDLRFFFGTKFDISTLLTRMGVNPLGN